MVWLEKKYIKEEIIVFYLNKFEFINGVYGIKVVLEIYFGIVFDNFKIEEVVMFVGMLKNFFLFNFICWLDMVLYCCMVVLK